MLSGWDGVNFICGVLSGWVEDDVEEGSGCCLRKSGKTLGGKVIRLGPGALIAGGRVTCRKTCHTNYALIPSLCWALSFTSTIQCLITLALSDLNVNAFSGWFIGIGSLLLLQGLFVLTQSLFKEFYHHRTYWSRCKQKNIGNLGIYSHWCVLFVYFLS